MNNALVHRALNKASAQVRYYLPESTDELWQWLTAADLSDLYAEDRISLDELEAGLEKVLCA